MNAELCKEKYLPKRAYLERSKKMQIVFSTSSPDLRSVFGIIKQLHSPQPDLEQCHVNECVLFYSYGGVALEYFQVYIMRKNPSSHYRGRENTFSVAQSVFHVVFPVIGGMLEVPVLRVWKKTLPLLSLTSEKAQKKLP